MLKVSKVKYLNDYILQILFNDGVTKTINFEELIGEGGFYFNPLNDVSFFKKVCIDEFNYTICWPNGAELSPETLYEMGTETKKVAKKPPSKRHVKAAAALKTRKSLNLR